MPRPLDIVTTIFTLPRALRVRFDEVRLARVRRKGFTRLPVE
jgi:hypothetical protein